jgi:hypothetical protein
MPVQVDHGNPLESFNAIDYQLFPEYCANWNTALNKMRL